MMRHWPFRPGRPVRVGAALDEDDAAPRAIHVALRVGLTSLFGTVPFPSRSRHASPRCARQRNAGMVWVGKACCSPQSLLRSGSLLARGLGAAQTRKGPDSDALDGAQRGAGRAVARGSTDASSGRACTVVTGQTARFGVRRFLMWRWGPCFAGPCVAAQDYSAVGGFVSIAFSRACSIWVPGVSSPSRGARGTPASKPRRPKPALIVVGRPPCRMKRRIGSWA